MLRFQTVIHYLRGKSLRMKPVQIPTSFLFFSLLFAFNTLNAQLVNLNPVSASDPLQGTTDLYQNSEMFFLWDQTLANNAIQVKSQIVDILYPPGQFQYNTVQVEQAINTNTGSRFLAIAKGDFDGDGFDDAVSAWKTAAGILISVPDIDKQTLGWSSANQTLVPGSLLMESSVGSYRGRIRLAAGNFDSDKQDEIALAYRTMTDNLLHIEVYNVDGSLQLLASVTDVSLSIYGGYESFDITVRDFDLDGTAEIALAYRNANSLFVRLYAMESGSLVSQTQTTVSSQLDASGFVISLCTGDFNKDVIAEIAIAWGKIDGNSGAQEDSYIQTLQVMDDSTTQGSVLDTIVFNPANKVVNRYSSSNQETLRLKAGDLNGDARDELLLGRRGSVDYYESNNSLALISKGSVSSFSDEFFYSDDFFDIADINKDGSADILLMKNYFDYDNNREQYFEVSVFTLNAQLQPTQAGQTNYQYQDLDTISGGNTSLARRHYAMIAGDFDGDRVRVGKGNKYVKTEIVQPLVILNAPPVHFDVLNGTTYDVCECYNNNSCQHRSTYIYQNDQQVRVETNISRDWGVSASLGAGGTFGPIGVSAKVTAKYGEKFSNTDNNTQKVTVITEVSAKDDDLIYATVCDYDAWEYPVYENDTLRGYILALEPKLTENRWFPSKSWSAFSYVPDHEVGNILSYREYAQFIDNPFSDETIRANTGDSYVLDASSSYNWTLMFSDFNSSSASTTKEIGLEVSAEISGWGVSVGASGSYNSSELSTHETQVGDQITIKAEIRNVDLGIGETRYTVTPYSYWSKNGSLTLDYAVRPEVPQTSGTPTWWTDNYDVQDPAFILPWRYDPEKGFTLQDQVKRRQTKSITFHPENPQVGDTVKIKARIHNFSLETCEPVKVSFYFDDPANNNIITGLNGETFMMTNSILARQSELLIFPFVLPSGLGSSPRIYASIDPDNTITEIHKNNNIGFNILGNQGFQPVGVESLDAPIVGAISKLYPNPALAIASIQFELKQPAFVSLKVYDMQGKEVKNLLEGNETPSIYDVSFDTRNLEAGVYVYRLQINDVSETQKLVLVK